MTGATAPIGLPPATRGLIVCVGAGAPVGMVRCHGTPPATRGLDGSVGPPSGWAQARAAPCRHSDRDSRGAAGDRVRGGAIAPSMAAGVITPSPLRSSAPGRSRRSLSRNAIVAPPGLGPQNRAVRLARIEQAPAPPSAEEQGSRSEHSRRRAPAAGSVAQLAICATSQYGRRRLALVRRIFRGLNNAEVLRARRGQSRIRPWRTSHA